MQALTKAEARLASQKNAGISTKMAQSIVKGARRMQAKFQRAEQEREQNRDLAIMGGAFLLGSGLAGFTSGMNNGQGFDVGPLPVAVIAGAAFLGYGLSGLPGHRGVFSFGTGMLGFHFGDVLQKAVLRYNLTQQTTT